MEQGSGPTELFVGAEDVEQGFVGDVRHQRETRRRGRGVLADLGNGKGEQPEHISRVSD